MQFQREKLTECWDEGLPLLAMNHAEVGAFSSEDFNPDRKRFEALEDVGALKLFTIRVAGLLVGYALFFIQPHLHFPKMVFAQQSAMFVLAEYRFRAARNGFIGFVDRELESLGVNVVYRHVSPKRDYSKTLERLGYQPTEMGFIRRF